MRSKLVTLVVVLMCVIWLGGCSGLVENSDSNEPDAVPAGGNKTEQKAGNQRSDKTEAAGTDETEELKDAEPVTITIASHSLAVKDEEFEKIIAAPVLEQYPHITVKRIDTAEEGRRLQDLVVAKEIPDIVADYPLNLDQLVKLNLAYNIEDLIKSHGLDTSVIQPEFLESIRIGSGLSHLVGLPIYNQPFGLYYNKGIFDRFAAAYPEDNMSWLEIAELGANLTRNEDGVQYWGLWPDEAYRGAYQLSLPWGDFENNKPVFQSEEWQQLFTFWANMYHKVGFWPQGSTDATKEFTEERLAMLASGATRISNFTEIEDLDWDVVTYPYHPDAPGVGQRVDAYVFAITEQSEHKNEAMQVISTVLSADVQTVISRSGKMAVLKDEEIQAQFGQDIGGVSAKNLVAFTEPKLALIQTFNNLPAASIIITAFREVVYGGKDVNTALREADEKMEQAIQEELKNR